MVFLRLDWTDSAILSVSFIAFCPSRIFAVFTPPPHPPMNSMWDLIPVQCVLVVSQSLQMTRVGASDCRGVTVMKGMREICWGWGVGEFMCVWLRKKGRGSKKKGVQCMCLVTLVNVFACNWMRNGQWIDCCYYVAWVGRKPGTQ